MFDSCLDAFETQKMIGYEANVVECCNCEQEILKESGYYCDDCLKLIFEGKL